MRNPILAAAFVLVAGCALTRSDPDTPELPLPDALPPVAQALPELPAPVVAGVRRSGARRAHPRGARAQSRHRDRRGPRRRGARHRACRKRRPAAVGRPGGRCRAFARKRADAAVPRSANDPDLLLRAGLGALRARSLGTVRACVGGGARAVACLRARPGSGAAEPERGSGSRLVCAQGRERAARQRTRVARQPRGIAAHRADPGGRWRERRVHAQARTGGGCSDPHGGAAVRARGRAPRQCARGAARALAARDGRRARPADR